MTDKISFVIPKKKKKERKKKEGKKKGKVTLIYLFSTILFTPR